MTVVAIDGPAGAGKSTVAKAVARALGFTYVDTGALYRAVAVAVLDRGVDPSDVGAVEALAGSLALEPRGDTARVDGVDVGKRLRTPEVSRVASLISAYAGVRRALLANQREMAAGGDLVMAGRDIGSTVVPDAPVKVFLTASLEERAARRAAQLGAEGAPPPMSEIERSIASRDDADSARDASPLHKAPGAIEIDSTGKAVDEVVDEIVAIVRKALDEG